MVRKTPPGADRKSQTRKARPRLACETVCLKQTSSHSCGMRSHGPWKKGAHPCDCKWVSRTVIALDMGNIPPQTDDGVIPFGVQFHPSSAIVSHIMPFVSGPACRRAHHIESLSRKSPCRQRKPSSCEGGLGVENEPHQIIGVMPQV